MTLVDPSVVEVGDAHIRPLVRRRSGSGGRAAFARATVDRALWLGRPIVLRPGRILYLGVTCVLFAVVGDQIAPWLAWEYAALP